MTATTGTPAASRRWRSWPLATVAVFAALGWLGYGLHTRTAALEQQLAQGSSEARASERQLREQLASQQERLGALDARLAAASGQQEIVQNLIRELAGGRDEALLLQVEQTLQLAQLQQQLRGNPPAVMTALETAAQLLSRSDTQRLAPLRQAVQRDLAQYRALRVPDRVVLGQTLNQAIDALDTLPLGYLAHPVDNLPATPSTATAPASTGWQQVLATLWLEFRSLIRIQRFDGSEPVLMAPSQAYFLRENLRLRLLHARLALDLGDAAAFRTDLQQAEHWLAQHFDQTQAPVQNQRQTLRQLAAQDIAPKLPGLDDSLNALRAVRPVRSRP